LPKVTIGPSFVLGMRVHIVTRRAQPPRGEELDRLEHAVARSLAPHAERLRRVVVSVEGTRMLRLRGHVLHEGGHVEVEHLDPGELADATPHFAERMGRAVARVLALGLPHVHAAAEPPARRRRTPCR
jgi:hypothetical protein